MSEDFKPKRYACKQWPFLRIRTVKFEAGFCTAKDENEVNLIESNPHFGIHIFPIKWEPKEVPAKAEVAELIEADLQAELAAKQPRVRRGAIGTR